MHNFKSPRIMTEPIYLFQEGKRAGEEGKEEDTRKKPD